MTRRGVMKGAGLGEDVYTGAADYGRFMAWLAFCVLGLVGLGLIFGGLAAMRRQDPHTIETQGTLQGMKCSVSVIEGRSETVCIGQVTYADPRVPGRTFTMPVSTSLAQDGGVVSVFINPSDPTKFVLHRFPYKGLGWTLIGVGLVMIVGVSINLYVALRFKFAAAAGGVSGAVNLIRQ